MKTSRQQGLIEMRNLIAAMKISSAGAGRQESGSVEQMDSLDSRSHCLSACYLTPVHREDLENLWEGQVWRAFLEISLADV